MTVTTVTIYQAPEGQVEVRTITGAPPLVFLNGVIQQPGTYSVSGTGVVFETRQFSRSSWKPFIIFWPKKINGRWYWTRDRVYRKFVLNPGVGGHWVYGDDFDLLRENNDRN